MSELLRRDPRRERIQRNRLHSLYQTLAPVTSSAGSSGLSILVPGSSGVVRKNPHRRGSIGPNGIRRIDRLDSKGSNDVSFSHPRSVIEPSSHLPLHCVEDAEFYIAVVPEMSSGRLTNADKDMLGLAQQLANGRIGGQSGGAVMTVLFAPAKGDCLTEAGVDRVLDLSSWGDEGYQPEYQLALLQQAEKQFTPRYWLFGDQTMNSADLGRRLAASLDERAATGVVEIDDNWVWCSAGLGGKEYRRPHERILLVAEQIAEPVSTYRYQARRVTLESMPEVHTKIDDMGLLEIEPGSVPLVEAEFVFAGGHGVTNWPLFHQAAAALGATEGASRVAVDDGNMPRVTQVGASGTWVSARVYVAVGISGAIQHMQGMTDCDTVIAINLDPGCTMVSRADLSVIGDSSEIMLALINQVKESLSDSTSDNTSNNITDNLAVPENGQAKEVWDDAV